MSTVGAKRQQVLENAQAQHGAEGCVAWHHCETGLDLDISEEAIRAASEAIAHHDDSLAAKISETIESIAESLYDEGDVEGAQSAARAAEVFQWALRVASEEPKTSNAPARSVEYKPTDKSAPGMSLLYLRALVLRARNNKEIGDRLHEETQRMRTRVRGGGEVDTRLQHYESSRSRTDKLDRDDRWRRWDEDQRYLRETEHKD